MVWIRDEKTGALLNIGVNSENTRLHKLEMKVMELERKLNLLEEKLLSICQTRKI